MRLSRISLCGFGPFRTPFVADLDAMGDAKLVAVTGENGAGKSTLLELGLPGAMYRDTPTRGSLVELATSRDACLEVTVVNGQSWTLRHLVDAVSKKSEALVLDGAGEPVLDDSKVRSFDAWAAKNMPAPEVLFASTFAPQGAAGFLGAKPAERKAILLRVLGIERLERMEASAREELKVARAALATCQARIADEKARGGDAEAIAQALGEARATAQAAEAQASQARQKLEAAEAEQRQIMEIRRTNEERTAVRQRLEAELDGARQKLSDVSGRLANNRTVLSEAAAIRLAVTESAELQVTHRRKQSAVVLAYGEAGAHLLPWKDVDGRRRSVQERSARARARLADKDLVARAAGAMAGLRDAVGAAGGEVKRLAGELEELRGRTLAGAEQRITELRGGLQEVSDKAAEAVEAQLLGTIADGALDVDDAAVTEAQQTPRRIAEVTSLLEVARDRLALAERHAGDAERQAARAADVAGAGDELDSAEAELRELEAGHAAAVAAEREGRAAADRLQAEVKVLERSIADRQSMVDKAGPLERAEARVAELEPQRDAAQADFARLEGDLAKALVPVPVPGSPNLQALEAVAKEGGAATLAAHRTVAQLEQRLELAQASVARLAELDAERMTVEAELADWARLAPDLGRDGLQALEIDAAGPELTTLVNDLLHSCHGPRFTVRIDTQRASSDGKRMIEGCDVVVLDTVAGREAEGSTFSGGERVIISEAISLALSTLACRRSGVQGPTLVRDESGAALSAGNGRIWISMLRRAIEQTGASRLLFVTHNPELVELADARIEVG